MYRDSLQGKDAKTHKLSLYLLPVIIGPTGVGKTKISIEVATRIGAEIVVCDSRQVYQGMDIGTDKPTQEELSKVKHWLISIVPPNVNLNAWEYAKMAREKIKEIWSRDKMAIVVAGTGLYLRALIDGLFKVPYYNKTIREKLELEPTYSLYKKLLAVDTETAHKLHQHDRMRIIRALEVYELTGRPISELKKYRVPFDCHPIYIGLNMARSLLYKKIELRVDRMIREGLIDEVKALMANYSPEINSLQTIGYKELIAYIQGKITLNEAIRLIKRNTRRYAKRQLTWFKRIAETKWIELPDTEVVEKCIKLIQAPDHF